MFTPSATLAPGAHVLHHPSAVVWFVAPNAPEQPDGAKRSLALSSHEEAASLAVEWPGPFLLQVVENSDSALSLTLVDSHFHHLEVNLYRLPVLSDRGSVFLGGSPRIDPEFTGYPQKPSFYSGRLLTESILPFLAARGEPEVVVRAHFGGAEKYFGDLGFEPDQKVGVPYMRYDLSKLRTLQCAPVPVVAPYRHTTLGTTSISELLQQHSNIQQELVAREQAILVAVQGMRTPEGKREVHDYHDQPNGRNFSRELFDLRHVLAQFSLRQLPALGR